MSQLYARTFVSILDSSIAEDFTLRHVFEDFLKLVNHKDGVVDITRQSMSRRLNIPIELLNEKIAILESPDPASRDSENEGRRLERLDEHRDWGWRIVNWQKYDEIRTRVDAAARVAKSRSATNPNFVKPTIEELKLAMVKAGCPEAQADRFWGHYEANGWRVGKNPMKSWPHAVGNWASNYRSQIFTGNGKKPENNHNHPVGGRF